MWPSRVPARIALRRRYDRLSEQSLGCDPSAVAQCLELRPDDVLGNAAGAGAGVEAAIGAGLNAARVAHDLRHALQAVSNSFRMLDDVGERIDHPRHDELIVMQRNFLQVGIVVRVLRIGEGQNEPADIGFEQERQDVLQRHIAIVRTLVVAPANMQAHPIARHVDERLVDGRHDPLDEIEEIR